MWWNYLNFYSSFNFFSFLCSCGLEERKFKSCPRHTWKNLVLLRLCYSSGIICSCGVLRSPIDVRESSGQNESGIRPVVPREADTVVFRDPFVSRSVLENAAVLCGSEDPDLFSLLCVSGAIPVSLEEEGIKESSSKVSNLAEFLWAGTTPPCLPLSPPSGWHWAWCGVNAHVRFCCMNEWMNIPLILLLF